jgi:hypothetical protein
LGKKTPFFYAITLFFGKYSINGKIVSKITRVKKLKCKCGGILSVIRVEEYPQDTKDKISYDRLCDVECLSCGKIYFSQPYDFGKSLNKVKSLTDD